MIKFYLLAAVSCFFVTPSFSQSGVLDQAFGAGGKVLTSAGDSTTSAANDIALQPDGKIVTGGYSYIAGKPVFTLVRYNADGTPDSSFGVNGIVYTAIRNNSKIYSIALQPDGKIVAGGNSEVDTTGIYISDFTIARYNTNGMLDSSFGTNGIIFTNFPFGYTRIAKVLIRPDGRIIGGGTIAKWTFEDYPVFAQYLPNGNADTTFGIGGQLEAGINTPPGSKATAVNDMALTADGKLIAVIESTPVGGYDYNNFLMLGLLPNGTIDTGFGNNGSVLTDINILSGEDAYGITILPDSSIVTVGNSRVISYSGFALAKYHANGTLDSTFGVDGKVITVIGNASATALKVVAEPSGKLIVSGTSGYQNTQNFIVAVYNANGTLDSSFGRRGSVVTDFFNYQDRLTSCAMQPDGKIILAGEVYNTSGQSSMALARYDRNRFVKYNTINGTVFIDDNRDGIKQANESYYNSAKINTANISSGYSTTIFTSNGRFSLDVDTSAYVTTVVNPLQYYTVVPASHTTNHNTYLNTDSVSFAMQAIPGQRDLAISLFPLGIARPGFPLSYKLFYINKGTDTVSGGSIEITKDSRLNFVSASPAAFSVSGNMLTWNYSDLKPGDTASINVNFTVSPQPLVNIGDTILSVANIFPSNTDLIPSDNSSIVKQIVRASYDPNDKTENHGGRITTTQLTNGDYLQYTIRFQNTGNDTAFNVYIHDTLSSKLDWSTLQMITASANYQMTMNDGKCLFTFSNINLVDSNHNEPASHGYIVYKIKPKPTVALGDVINNTAAIYFDYNLPVYTNTEMTNVVSETFPLKLLTFTAKKQDNTNLLQWTTAQEINVDHFEIERSKDGKEFERIGSVHAGMTNYAFIDNKPLSTASYYRLRMIDRDGKFTYSPIRIINNSTIFSVSIYPNPAKDKLQIMIDIEKKTPLQLQVLSLDGKVLLSSSFTANEGSVLRSININTLQKGTYFLKVTSLNPPSEGREAIVKFEKM